jgi:hypothetical protein
MGSIQGKRCDIYLRVLSSPLTKKRRMGGFSGIGRIIVALIGIGRELTRRVSCHALQTCYNFQNCPQAKMQLVTHWKHFSMHLLQILAFVLATQFIFALLMAATWMWRDLKYVRVGATGANGNSLCYVPLGNLAHTLIQMVCVMVTL